MKEEHTGIITRVSGPLVEATGMESAQMYEVVKVSEEKLLGEIIELRGGKASIQVYEETANIGPGEPVYRTGRTMSVELAPGLLESIYDGIQRPLKEIEERSGDQFIARGIEANGIDREKTWEFTPHVEAGAEVTEGDVLGEVPETSLITHKVMVPPGVSGTVSDIKSGNFTVVDEIARIKTTDGEEKPVHMLQYWPIRTPRPTQGKIYPEEPLLTGTRTIDTFFPVVKGGVAAIPGPFGSGKTVTQQGLARYCDAQVIVYIGCGERGNEMTEVLDEFPELKDPNTGEPLMRRTILIANTSNMPVAAREASIYTGITIAEYYRDMGYSVALMADSTSRWAEAMREISGRMEEMPGEEGYPAYLASRTAEFYERAGKVTCLGGDNRTGALTAVGAVSPPGGDLSEPVSQATLRVTKCYWGLDASLAYRKHFPSIHWLNSYSLYVDNVENWWRTHIAPDFPEVRAHALELLQEESKLMEIVRLVGMEALSNEERLVLEVSKSLREDFLFQNALDPDDAFTPNKKQYGMLATIMTVYNEGKKVVSQDEFDFARFQELESVQALSQLKQVDADNLAKFDEMQEHARTEIGALAQESAQV